MSNSDIAATPDAQTASPMTVRFVLNPEDVPVYKIKSSGVCDPLDVVKPEERSSPLPATVVEDGVEEHQLEGDAVEVNISEEHLLLSDTVVEVEGRVEEPDMPVQQSPDRRRRSSRLKRKHKQETETNKKQRVAPSFSPEAGERKTKRKPRRKSSATVRTLRLTLTIPPASTAASTQSSQDHTPCRVRTPEIPSQGVQIEDLSLVPSIFVNNVPLIEDTTPFVDRARSKVTLKDLLC